jgi:hypothetical protein
MTIRFYSPRRPDRRSNWFFARWTTPLMHGIRLCGFTWLHYPDNANN